MNTLRVQSIRRSQSQSAQYCKKQLIVLGFIHTAIVGGDQTEVENQRQQPPRHGATGLSPTTTGHEQRNLHKMRVFISDDRRDNPDSALYKANYHQVDLSSLN